jgi:hypothetical protein
VWDFLLHKSKLENIYKNGRIARIMIIDPRRDINVFKSDNLKAMTIYSDFPFFHFSVTAVIFILLFTV